MTEAAAIETPSQAAHHRRLQWRILIGFIAGLIGGLTVYATAPGAEWVNTIVTYVTAPIGQIFLRLLFMLVIPLLVSALVVGIAEMGEIRTLRQIGLATLGYTIAVSTIAVAISLLLVNLLQPGGGVDPAMARSMLSEAGGNAAGIIASSGEAKTGLDALVTIIPTNVIAAMGANDILAVMFFALFFGIGLLLTQGPRTAPLLNVFEGVFDVSMRLINIVIQLAPIAIFCFMFNLRAQEPVDVLPPDAGSQPDGVRHGIVQRHLANRAARCRNAAEAATAHLALRADHRRNGQPERLGDVRRRDSIVSRPILLGRS